MLGHNIYSIECGLEFFLGSGCPGKKSKGEPQGRVNNRGHRDKKRASSDKAS